MSAATRLSGRTALVTGAAGGIGAATAERLIAEGARVLLVDRSEDVQATARRLGAVGLVLDLRVRDAGERAAQAALDIFGRLDILVNNAGIGRARSLKDTDDEHLEQMIDINLTAVLRLTRAVAPRLKRPGGRIVSVSSTLGLVGHPGTTAYAVTKAGIAQLTRQLAAELGPEGILVNAVAPGAIDTPMTAERIRDDRFYQRAFIHSVPIGRAGTPEEIASVIAFLASDDASFVNGQVIAVDGGWLAGRHLPRSYVEEANRN